MKGNVGELMYEILKSYGVTHLFGMDDPLHLYQALDKTLMKPITVRDEKHGAIMAHGYAKVTNKPGICTAISGPGMTNLITGLLESQKSSTPVIALIQDIKTSNRGRNAPQELDHESVLRPVVKCVERLDDPGRITDITRKVFRIATSGRPGPVALLCPVDIMGMIAEVDTHAQVGFDRYPSVRSVSTKETIEQAINILKRAKRPVLIAGGGAIISRAWNEVMQLSEMYSIPVATTLMGKGIIPELHPLSIGVMGSYTGGKNGSGKVANQIVSEADVVFIMGSRTDPYPYLNWTIPKRGTKIIHLDIDPEEIGRNFETDLGMIGDIKSTLQSLIEYCLKHNIMFECNNIKDRITTLKKDWMALNRTLWNSKQEPIRPERLLKELSYFIDANTIVVTDASYVSSWATSHLINKAPGCNFIIPRGAAGIGWGLPAALGAKIGSPEKRIVCLTGDGAFGYVLAELETASRYNICVTTIVLNNKSLGYQKHYEQLMFGKSVECDFLDIDYGEVARALKCQGERITDPGNIKTAFTKAFNACVPYVIDVVIDHNAIPPLTLFEKFNTEEEGARKDQRCYTGH